MSIHEYNGGTLVGMVGKDCVGIACDRRFGKELLTITNDFQRVFKMQDNIIMGLGGLGTDVQTFSAQMEEKINLYSLKENKPMKPTTFCNLVAYSLFEKRYTPVYADSEVILCSLLSLALRMESLFWPATTLLGPSAWSRDSNAQEQDPRNWWLSAKPTISPIWRKRSFDLSCTRLLLLHVIETWDLDGELLYIL